MAFKPCPPIFWKIFQAMPRVLRSDELITHLQTRAPEGMWRYLKRLSMLHSSNGTLSRFFTQHLLEYIERRPWERMSWQRPQEVERKAGLTGFIQVNLPFTNLANDGHEIVTKSRLQHLGVEKIARRGDPMAYDAAVESGDLVQVLERMAEAFEVTKATLGYSYLYWLSVHRYKPKAAETLDLDRLPEGVPLLSIDGGRPRRVKG
jgi:hypothetical protein